MENQTQEARMILAINTIQSRRNISIRKTAKFYNVPYSTLYDRLNGRICLDDKIPYGLKLTRVEEEVLVRHILELDTRGFAPRLAGVEDMANHILDARQGQHVGGRWAQRFVQRHLELKPRFSRVYDFQRALCEDPELIGAWFRLVANMRAKYGIQDCDFWNFDETGFMMGIIAPAMVVTRADRRGRSKAVQPGNREWATAIVCVNGEGRDIPPFLLVSGINHLASWYTESDLPANWPIKPTGNGWTNNETGLDWIKHFEKHTRPYRQGGYRMLILDGHESHGSYDFQAYCKEQNIIILCLPAHSSHLTQPLDVGCFSVLKRMYSRQIEIFIKAHINHVSKIEFFIAFHAAYKQSITAQNAQAGFRGAGLIPFDPQAVISKMDIRLRTPELESVPVLEPWLSQTPHNSSDALLQSTLVKAHIDCHRGSSPSPIFQTVRALAKGTEIIAHKLTLVTAENRMLRTANEALSRRRRAKRTRIQDGGMLTLEEATDVLARKEATEESRREKRISKVGQNQEHSSGRHCSKCGNSGHNSRTCSIVVDTSTLVNSV